MSPDNYELSLSFAALSMERTLRATLYNITRDVDTTSDLLQELHLRLMHRSAAGIKNPEAYIHAAARHVAIDWISKGARYLNHSRLLHADDNSVPSSEKSVSDRQLAELILERLPPRQAQAIMLVKVQGYSTPEAASELGVTPGTIKSYLSAVADFRFRHDFIPQEKNRDVRGKLESRGKLLYNVQQQIEVPAKELIRSVEPKLIIAGAAIAERLRHNPDDMYNLPSRDFEHLILEILLDRGHEAHLTPATRDGGKDILAYFDSDIYGRLLCLIETKRYARHRKVGFDIVQRLYGAFADHGASCAMLVTTSSFTEPARTLQARHRYQLALREYGDIVKWLRDYGVNGKNG